MKVNRSLNSFHPRHVFWREIWEMMKMQGKIRVLQSHAFQIHVPKQPFHGLVWWKMKKEIYKNKIPLSLNIGLAKSPKWNFDHHNFIFVFNLKLKKWNTGFFISIFNFHGNFNFEFEKKSEKWLSGKLTFINFHKLPLTLSWRRFLSYKNINFHKLPLTLSWRRLL